MRKFQRRAQEENRGSGPGAKSEARVQTRLARRSKLSFAERRFRRELLYSVGP